MKRERKKRLLHELGFTAFEVQTIEELSAKRTPCGTVEVAE